MLRDRLLCRNPVSDHDASTEFCMELARESISSGALKEGIGVLLYVKMSCPRKAFT
jgi:hypothetical protein